MSPFLQLLNEKNDRLNSVPNNLLTAIEKQQKRAINDVIKKLTQLNTDSEGNIKITASNIKLVSEISDELKDVLINDDYLKSVNKFATEFSKQSVLNNKIITEGFGSSFASAAASEYITTAKKNAIKALTGSAIDTNFTVPISDLLEKSVVNGSTVSDTINAINSYAEGKSSKLLQYSKQIASDSFAVADRSYTSIVSDYLDNDWYYFAGTTVEGTRCFCKERVGNFYHYKEIESWANGDNLGDCDIGGGKWAGEIKGTNTSNIYSYLGGYFCLHSLMPVSEAIVPQSDIDRAVRLGFINQ